MKKTVIKPSQKISIKAQSIAAFINGIAMYPRPLERPGHRDSDYYDLQDEIHIKKVERIDVGDFLVVDLTERTNLTGQEVQTQMVYKCEAYDDVSRKLIRQK